VDAGEKSWPVTFSIGAVTELGHASSAEALIRAADQAMYRVKKNGKDGIHLSASGERPRVAAVV
jgi:GGDEF domain-containing protein